MFNRQKKYFKQKAIGVQKMIWDLEFKKLKTLSIREDIRREYDNLKQKLDALDKQKIDKKDKEEVANHKVILNKDIERMENQMKRLDLEVYGSKKTNEYPDGVEGITHQLDALQELKIMIKDYIKQL